MRKWTLGFRGFCKLVAGDQICQALQQVERCSERRILSEALQIYSQIVEQDITQDGLLGASIVRMFIKCGSTSNARQVFEKMADRRMVLWTCMVTAYVDLEEFDQSWILFFRMQLEGVLPDRVTFITILNACECQQRVRHVRGLISQKGLESNVVISNALLKAMAKCSDLDGAAQFFENMSVKDVISWTSMISANAQAGYFRDALAYYFKMLLEGVFPNNITFLAVLGACTSRTQGWLVRSHIVEAEWESDTMVANALINMFSKCGSLEDARLVFQGMNRWFVSSWNAIIGACTQHGCTSEALELFWGMKSSGSVSPDKVSLVSVLSACESLSEGKLVHECCSRELVESDVIVGTALVGMYSRCGSLSDARDVFEGIREKNVVSWNTMIAAYSQCEAQRSTGIGMFRRMMLEGVKPTRTTILNVMNAVEELGFAKQLCSWTVGSGIYSDLFIGSGLVNMLERAGSLKHAREAFERIIERDVFSWNSIMGACIKRGVPRDALRFFRKMGLEGTAANRATFLILLDAFSSSESLALARGVHSLVLEAGFESDTNIGNALITMYTRCGSLEDCRSIFNKMEERTVVSWTSFIAACKELGEPAEAIRVFLEKMDLEPDKVTLTTVLEACTESSAKKEGKMIHSRVLELGLETDSHVASALIHMYSKFGNMPEAGAIFSKLDMPNLACWNAMLGGYAQAGHMKEVIDHFRLMQLSGMPPDHITFLVLVSACSHAGDVEKGIEFFGYMSGDFGVAPVVEDYGCLIDLLARAGRVGEAFEYLRRIPFMPSDVMWKTLVAACKLQGDVWGGKSAARRILENEPLSAGAYIELYNMSIAEQT